jgi:Holliday junction resolvase
VLSILVMRSVVRMLKSESKIQKEIIAYLKERGCHVIRNAGSFRNGEADLIACVSGKFVAIEVKKEGEKPKELQLAKQKSIQASGGVSIIAYCVDDVRNALPYLNMR